MDCPISSTTSSEEFEQASNLSERATSDECGSFWKAERRRSRQYKM